MKAKAKDDLPYIDKPEILSAELRRLYNERISTKNTTKINRKSLKKQDKIDILNKTGSCCHICGQDLDESDFQIDHIVPLAIGGDSDVENCLAACNMCNSYRWDYLPEELRWIMKVGVWSKTQIEFETEIGKIISESFVEYEKSREQRRKSIRQALKMDTEKYPIRERIDYSKTQRKSKNHQAAKVKLS
jgi:hypothetical protein